MKTSSPDARAAALPPERLRGLSPRMAGLANQVARHWSHGEHSAAEHLLLELAANAPDHPEVLRWQGVARMRQGLWNEAAERFSRAARQRPADGSLRTRLAEAQEREGYDAAALATLQESLACVADASDALDLAIEADRQGRAVEALAAVEIALRRRPGWPLARLQHVRCLQVLGDAQGAAAECRALIAGRQLVARAWFALLDLKTVPLLAGELEALEKAARLAPPASEEAMLLAFALGKACEDAGRFGEALDALHRANEQARRTHPWNALSFSRHAAAVRAAFADGVTPSAADQGHEVIFLVGLPRSGTTLVEQVLAAHSRVEGASELPYLDAVLQDESRRRGRPFPEWVRQASQDDWTRLGTEYLRRSARWRARRPVATDKLPENWLLAGAVMAMLPAARIIDCRRDPVETSWSCYKQLFGPGRVGFTYDFAALAAYWRDYDAMCSEWALKRGDRFRVQRYEELVADPEGQVRALLAFCGLPFEPACLAPHAAQRAIRTPSSSQVRQPMRSASTPARGYGELLAPLRALLAAR